MSEDEMLYRCDLGKTPDTCRRGECMVVDEDDVAWFCSHLLRPYEATDEEGRPVTKWEKAHIMPPVPTTP